VAASDTSIPHSPLALACRFPEAATNGMVERLLHCKVDVDSPCRSASTDRPLSAAVGAPVVSMETVQALVQAKASIDGAVRFPPLIKAVTRGHVDVVRYLCAAKADVHLSNYTAFVHLLARPSHSLRRFFLPTNLFFFDYGEDPAVAASYHRARMQVLELPHDEGLTTDGLLDREYCWNRQKCVRVLLRAKAVIHMSPVVEIAGELMHNAAQHVAFNGT